MVYYFSCVIVSELIKGSGSWMSLDLMPRRGRTIPLNSIAWFYQEDVIRNNWIQSYIHFLLLPFCYLLSCQSHDIKYFMICIYLMICSDMFWLFLCRTINCIICITNNSYILKCIIYHRIKTGDRSKVTIYKKCFENETNTT